MNDKQREVATFAGGCFWCLEAVYDQIRGVESVVSGYTGGALADPGYEAVCRGDTGHAEAVEITFDPAQVSYEELLAVFFSIHDPTTRDRQGHDIGPQYRSAVFTHNETQRAQVEKMISELSDMGVWADPIVTEVCAAEMFYPAEAYHQHFYASHPEHGYCNVVIAPKLAWLRSHFSRLTKRA